MKYLTQLQNPVVNLNGNSASSLVDQLKGVLTALTAVEQAMHNASDCWHGRNFQTLPDGEARQRATMDAWHERMRAIADTYNEVMAMALDVQKQGSK